jgi:hypothetical protein
MSEFDGRKRRFGSTIAGVDAALSFLMNDSKMGPILRKAAQPGGLGNFEVLLGADFLKSSSPDAQLFAMRFYTENDRKQNQCSASESLTDRRKFTKGKFISLDGSSRSKQFACGERDTFLRRQSCDRM